MTTSKRTILVTGASSGIGLAISRYLLSQGHRVIGIARHIDTAPVDDTAFLGQSIDLADLDSLSDRIQQLLRSPSNAFQDISALICCAGQGRFGSLEEFSCDQIRQLMDLNFTSHACLVRELLPLLKKRSVKQGSGHIIFIGSEAALRGGRRGAIYSASKFALRGFAQALREECASSDIAVSIINPGMVRTGFFDRLSFRPGPDSDHAILPDDVAAAVSLVLTMRAGSVIDEINLSPLKKVIAFDAGPNTD